MTAKLHRAVRCTAAVLAALAVGAGATACGSSTDTSSAKAGAHSRTAGEATGSALKETAAQGSRTDAVNTLSAAATSKRCHTGELRYSWGLPHGGHPDMDATSQQTAGIRLKNGSGRTCTLHGFPGVRLISKSGEAWDLRRSSDKPSTVTLRPGQSTAMVSLTLLPTATNDPDTKAFVPSKVLLTPPDETTHVTLKWPYGGAILDQSGATRPGTFVSPVGVG
ncbi:DUF4232 domain-containing protein [Streptomyces albus]|uniref:DUF4232 domain-containing protein n=1 Tax=Streptomyces albus TaxID=1888 RepID=A0A6C1BYD8_9ACTN|nr:MULTISPECIES: DUF4232 domain-containing protein [Streptomyces]KPC91650.1 hypothetical protein ADL27_29235 [Streptomyces sp. NRRL F-6602]EPD97117.1 hypothetical protein HMPREF1486_00348 [Streptomyces sp. HPH0547]QID34870.1 DUF4232 domain-containing protein [Streptomyces albus]TGG74660.1 DUF4232 domain-containing protein [Streptomyces albus]UVN58328.1 DUF4232 domain-containing protein [Streptomyces albus]